MYSSSNSRRLMTKLLPSKGKCWRLKTQYLKKRKKSALEDAVTDLGGRIDYVRSESLEKCIKLMKTTVTTASTILTTKNEPKDVTE